MATPNCNFTEKELDAWVRETLDYYAQDPVHIPPDGQAWIKDQGGKNSVPGLRLRLRLRRDGGRFTLDNPHCGFFIVRKIDGQTRMLKVGDRAVYSVEMARHDAKEEQRNLSQGVDKRADRKQKEQVDKALSVTFRDALTAFLNQADVSEGTRKKYCLALTTTFKDRADKPLVDLTERVVLDLHKERSKESPSRADQDFRVLRLLWNWARLTYLDQDGNSVLPENPVPKVLNKRRAAGATKAQWNNVPRRETIIPEDRLGDWFNALDEIRTDQETNGVRARTCDLLEALALTGLKLNELTILTWERVDFALGTISIPGDTTKNHRPLIRPMTRQVRIVLQRRFGERESFPETDLVFPGRTKGQPIRDPRALHQEIATRTGLSIVAHDLRRVFASAALRAGVPQLVIKRLLNHLTNNREVTEGYQVLGMDALRDYSQATEDHILGKAGRLSSPEVDTQILELLTKLSEDEKRQLLLKIS